MWHYDVCLVTFLLRVQKPIKDRWSRNNKISWQRIPNNHIWWKILHNNAVMALQTAAKEELYYMYCLAFSLPLCCIREHMPFRFVRKNYFCIFIVNVTWICLFSSVNSENKAKVKCNVFYYVVSFTVCTCIFGTPSTYYYFQTEKWRRLPVIMFSCSADIQYFFNLFRHICSDTSAFRVKTFYSFNISIHL